MAELMQTDATLLSGESAANAQSEALLDYRRVAILLRRMSKSRFTRVLLAISLGTGLVCILWYAPDSMASFVRGCFMIPGALVAILGVLIFGYYQPVFDPVTFIGNALFYSWLAFMLLKLVKEKRAKPTTDAESTKTVTQSQ